MESFLDLVKLLLPAGIVLYAMYLLVRSYIRKETEQQLIALQMKSKETLLPLRFQACERVCLFLERILPENLLPRLNKPNLTARQFQQMLTTQVRDEFNHNFSQQLYISDATWKQVKNAVNELINTINIAASQLTVEASALDLGKKIIEISTTGTNDLITEALRQVKEEVRKEF